MRGGWAEKIERDETRIKEMKEDERMSKEEGEALKVKAAEG